VQVDQPRHAARLDVGNSSALEQLFWSLAPHIRATGFLRTLQIVAPDVAPAQFLALKGVEYFRLSI
jgi:hypothetical protein